MATKEDPRQGRQLSDDGRYFMWKDSLYSNSRGYDPMERSSIAGGTIQTKKERVHV